jgi:flagellar basal body-associated protein FliL
MSELTKAEKKKKHITQEDIDNLLDSVPDPDEVAADKTSSKVILAPNIEKNEIPTGSGLKKDKTIPWYRSKLLWIGASLTLVLSLSMMFYLKPDKKNDSEAIKSTITRFPIVRTSEELNRPSAVFSNPLSIPMREFVVFASPVNTDIALLYTNVRLNLSHKMAAEEIKKNYTFIRYIIYDTLKEAFVSGDKEKITEAYLRETLKKALNRALERELVKEIVLDSFKVI